jgi:serine/threonine protein kinase
MAGPVTCSKCGHRMAEPQRPAAYCPNCGERIISTGSAETASDLTMVESGSSQPRSISTTSDGRTSGSLPRNIDGYDIVAMLGQGGMGSVYLGYEPLLDREVAVKVLSRRGEETESSRGAARFLSEAVLTGRLGHGGIIPIYKIGHDLNVGFYYAMRYVKGRTLADILAALQLRDESTRAEFGLTRLLTIFLRVCQAVGFAHEHRIVHRDIKPSNIIVADFGEVFVLDWGLAKDISALSANDAATLCSDPIKQRLSECRRRRGSTSQMFLMKDARPSGSNTSVLRRLQAMKVNAIREPATQADQILGTPGYLSPEQGNQKNEITPASDVYSLGVTLYEILTLHRPVEAPTPEGAVLKTITGDIVPISRQSEAARLPAVLCDIVTRAIALNPQDRFANASELAADIALYLDGRSAWKLLSSARFTSQEVPDWKVLEGAVRCSEDGSALSPQTRLNCSRVSMGDLQAELQFFAGGSRWIFDIDILEALSNGSCAKRYTLRLGNDGRSFVELLREGVVVQRRLDVRLRSNQRYTVKIAMEQARIELALNGRPLIKYYEVFPQTGGAIEMFSNTGNIHLVETTLMTRGAPLHLAFTSLPDGLYRSGNYQEARELYRRLAASHPDREEGMLATFKAGLCSTSLNDMDASFAEFSRLEGTMCDHYCALGLAQIGAKDGNIDWAWEALKNTCRKCTDSNIRADMWFALLNLVQRLPTKDGNEKVRRYTELLSELTPEPAEAAHVTYELLDAVDHAAGPARVREEAVSLIDRFPGNAAIREEALFALWRSGIDQESVPIAAENAVRLIQLRTESAARLHLLLAETSLANGMHDKAYHSLRDAIIECGVATPDGIWAKSWQILILNLKQQYQLALTDTHETIARVKRCCTPAQLSYLRLLEALAFYGRNQPAKALSAVEQATRTESLWGLAAAHVLEENPPFMLPDRAAFAAPPQIAEALWLSGELLAFAGKKELALGHFQQCLSQEFQRAMITSLAQRSISALETPANRRVS